MSVSSLTTIFCSNGTIQHSHNLNVFRTTRGVKDDSSMEEPLQPYEILATDAIGNPTFIDFISTKVKSDEKSVYEFLKTVYGFDEHTTFTTYLEQPFF